MSLREIDNDRDRDSEEDRGSRDSTSFKSQELVVIQGPPQSGRKIDIFIKFLAR